MKHASVLTQAESRRLCLFLLNSAAVIGIIIGAIIAVADYGNESIWLHQYFSPMHSGNTLIEVFRNTFLSSLLFLCCNFTLGMSAIGQPLGVGLLIYRGVGIGFSVAFMYMQSGFEAIPAVLLLVMPKAVVIIFLSSLAIREMLKLSAGLFRCVFRDSSADTQNSRTFRLYCIKFTVIAAVLLLVSVLDSALNYFFMDLI